MMSAVTIKMVYFYWSDFDLYQCAVIKTFILYSILVIADMRPLRAQSTAEWSFDVMGINKTLLQTWY